mmetsp:Transcript_27637/g.41808  ORF Transcript_27637/g.41808 Transcript_27637/m.41808 type:complete len:87 (-) Transcript_27637:73-333(-)
MVWVAFGVTDPWSGGDGSTGAVLRAIVGAGGGDGPGGDGEGASKGEGPAEGVEGCNTCLLPLVVATATATTGGAPALVVEVVRAGI